MKKSASKIIDHHIETDQNSTDDNKNLKTTNINILLNRVRLEKKDKSKKRIIFFISVISVLSFLIIILSGD